LERDHIKSAANMSAKTSSIDVRIPIGDITTNGRLKKLNLLFAVPPLKKTNTHTNLTNIYKDLSELAS